MCRCFAFFVNVSVVASYDGDYFSEDFHRIDDDGFVIVVFRLEAEMTVFLIEAFYGGGIFHKGDDDLAVSCFGSAADDYDIAVKDSAFYHGVAVNMESKKIRGIARIGNVFVNFFFRKDR